MNDFEKLLSDINKFNVNEILKEVWSNPRVQNFIIELNTEGKPTSQLFEKGEDSLGISLGVYSDFTKAIKFEKGQRLDHITLKDTGDFYETFDVVPLLLGFRLEANGDKGGGDNLFEDFGKDIVGLNEENIIILGEFIQPFFTAAAKKRLPQ